jgi:hypothetical protein
MVLSRGPASRPPSKVGCHSGPAKSGVPRAVVPATRCSDSGRDEISCAAPARWNTGALHLIPELKPCAFVSEAILFCVGGGRIWQAFRRIDAAAPAVVPCG